MPDAELEDGCIAEEPLDVQTDGLVQAATVDGEDLIEPGLHGRA